MNLAQKNIFTQAVHAGERAPRPDFTPVATAIYNSVAYIYDDLADLDAVFGNQRPGYVYTRYGNPTGTALELALATLEGGEAAMGFASGMAALHAALLAAGVQAGTAVVAARDLYGATYTLLTRLFSRLGAEVRFVDITDLSAVEQALAEAQPVAVLMETMSNPLLRVADVPAVIRLAHAVGARVIVDNTFVTPYLCQPLEHGADYVVHSTTKYLSGHGDAMGGVVVTSAANRATLHELSKMTGAILGPNEAWLTLRGLKTLPLRMERHCHNAATVAAWLSEQPRVDVVNYPGLASHPQHRLVQQLFRSEKYGGMISFEIRNAGQAEVFHFLEALELILPATTLGDVYSLALYPAHSSHRALSAEERAHIGIGDGLVRLSVGIEAVEDIIADLEQALAQV
jgi:cystathionine beta-lyase/cystathionine gamma-synthase